MSASVLTLEQLRSLLTAKSAELAREITRLAQVATPAECILVLARIEELRASRDQVSRAFRDLRLQQLGGHPQA